MPIDHMDQEKTTFTCPFGTYAYKRMPFGLCNAPSTFQRCMLAILHDMIEQSVEVFMDDFLVFGNSFDKCLNNLEKMLQRYKDANLVLNWEKYHFMVKEGIVLKHKVSGACLEVDKAKIDVIFKLLPPREIARLESIRILLAYACALDFKLFQMDVKSAFLNGFINEEEVPKTLLEAVKCIFRYIKGSTHLGLWYPKGTEIETSSISDSDLPVINVDRKSTSGEMTLEEELRAHSEYYIVRAAPDDALVLGTSPSIRRVVAEGYIAQPRVRYSIEDADYNKNRIPYQRILGSLSMPHWALADGFYRRAHNRNSVLWNNRKLRVLTVLEPTPTTKCASVTVEAPHPVHKHLASSEDAMSQDVDSGLKRQEGTGDDGGGPSKRVRPSQSLVSGTSGFSAAGDACLHSPPPQTDPNGFDAEAGLRGLMPHLAEEKKMALLVKVELECADRCGIQGLDDFRQKVEGLLEKAGDSYASSVSSTPRSCTLTCCNRLLSAGRYRTPGGGLHDKTAALTVCLRKVPGVRLARHANEEGAEPSLIISKAGRSSVAIQGTYLCQSRDILNPFTWKDGPLKESLEGPAIRWRRRRRVLLAWRLLSPKDCEFLGKLEEAGDAGPYQLEVEQKSLSQISRLSSWLPTRHGDKLLYPPALCVLSRRALIPSPRTAIWLRSTKPLVCGCLTDAKRCVMLNLEHRLFETGYHRLLSVVDTISEGPKNQSWLMDRNVDRGTPHRSSNLCAVLEVSTMSRTTRFRCWALLTKVIDIDFQVATLLVPRKRYLQSLACLFLVTLAIFGLVYPLYGPKKHLKGTSPSYHPLFLTITGLEKPSHGNSFYGMILHPLVYVLLQNGLSALGACPRFFCPCRNFHVGFSHCVRDRSWHSGHVFWFPMPKTSEVPLLECTHSRPTVSDKNPRSNLLLRVSAVCNGPSSLFFVDDAFLSAFNVTVTVYAFFLVRLRRCIVDGDNSAVAGNFCSSGLGWDRAYAEIPVAPIRHIFSPEPVNDVRGRGCLMPFDSGRSLWKQCSYSMSADAPPSMYMRWMS
ncbi:reverse transcriptase domain-containing protein [Tanacetum coccineum]